MLGRASSSKDVELLVLRHEVGSVNLIWPHLVGAGSSHRRNAGGCDRADGSGGQRITAAARSVGVVSVWRAQARVAAARARALP